MKRLLSIALALAALLTSCTDTPQTDHRYDAGVSKELAQWREATIKDVSYHLLFDLVDNWGCVSIWFSLEERQDVVLDLRNTDLVREICLGDSYECITHLCELRNEHIIVPASETRVGKQSISILFNLDNQSLNRSPEFLYTLLVPDRARTLFPVFDQPDIKAWYELNLIVPDSWVAISNTPTTVDSWAAETYEYYTDEVLPEGKKVVSFQPTEPLSTYLFSFVAGKFQSRTYDDGTHRFTAYYRETDPKRLEQLDDIFAQVKASLVWLEEYTAVPYPFAKYDFVMLPGFQYGGMEHTGATLYNDRQMFLGENPTLDEELRRTQLIAHETAHMWFGDYVTMRWFDDVWTKEIFANYFAARMAEPLYPTIDHRLSRLKSYTTAALNEDRTAGATSIRQELDNLQNAGLIYGQTIYNKAPIVMDKLVEILGDEAFKLGIREYLNTYAFGNATWPELIAILDKYTDADLATFSDVWVHSKGMPRIETAFSDGVLTVAQSDPLGRGLCWRQSFGCRAVLADGTTRDIEVTTADEVQQYNIPTNTIALLPNSDGRGYGLFVPDEASMRWVMTNMSTIETDVTREALIMMLNECYEWHIIDARAWLDFLLNYLPTEHNYLITSTLNGYLAKPMLEVATAEDEERLWIMANNHAIASLRRPLVMTLAAVATSESVVAKLNNAWRNESIAQLDENDAMKLALELAVRMPEQRDDIIATQRARLTNDDRVRQFDYIARATTPDIEARDALFEWLLTPENRRPEPWAASMLAILNHHTRQREACKYIYRGLEELSEVQRTGDIFFPRNWTGALLGGHHSAEAANEVKRFLSDHPDYNPLLRNKILQAANLE